MITYRLEGSIPKDELRYLSDRRRVQVEKLDVKILEYPKNLREQVYTQELFLINARFEMAIENALHTVTSGPFYLQQPPIRRIVMDSWLNLHDRAKVFVLAICVMGNHVHVIVKAPESIESVLPGKLMEKHKGYTARLCNKILNQVGASFWNDTYFDRVVRKGRFMTAMWYLLNNPVKAGLVENWQDWEGNYVHPEYIDLFR